MVGTGKNGIYYVSIPDRYAKNLALLQSFQTRVGFQFLIGTLKTVYQRLFFFPFLVSIPDRYAKNELPHPYRLYFTVEFQFLIGTLKTCRNYFLMHYV